MSTVKIKLDDVTLNGELVRPTTGSGIVLFAHGSGSSRMSPRNRYVASVLQQHGMGTLLFDLLTPEEDRQMATRFDITLLTRRLLATTIWLQENPAAHSCKFGYFGASTGAAAALQAAAQMQDTISAVVSRGGRPDLAGEIILKQVKAPTLLLVGSEDYGVIELNEQAYSFLQCDKKLVLIQGATHLFEEPGTLEQVALEASHWFMRYFTTPASPQSDKHHSNDATGIAAD